MYVCVCVDYIVKLARHLSCYSQLENPLSMQKQIRCCAVVDSKSDTAVTDVDGGPNLEDGFLGSCDVITVEK